MAAKKPDDSEAVKEQAPAFSNRRRNMLTVAVVGGLMLVEGIGIVLAVKYLVPASTEAGTNEGSGGGDGFAQETEIPVTDLVAYNSQAGRVFVYQMSVYADVAAENVYNIKKLFEARRNTIDDRLSKVIRGADPKYMDEPGLETLRRQFKHELDAIVGDETVIREILFPEFNKSRAD